MSARGMQMLIASSIVDRRQQAALLERRSEAYMGFDLTDEEIDALLSIDAATLQEFAWRAHFLFYREKLSLGSAAGPQMGEYPMPDLEIA